MSGSYPALTAPTGTDAAVHADFVRGRAAGANPDPVAALDALIGRAPAGGANAAAPAAPSAPTASTAPAVRLGASAPASAAAQAPGVSGTVTVYGDRPGQPPQPPLASPADAAPVVQPRQSAVQRLLTLPPPKAALDALGSALPQVAKDVGTGVLDAPRQIIGGGLDLINNVVKFADVAVRDMDAAGVPNLYVQLFDPQGNFAPAVLTPSQYHAAETAGQTGLFQVPTTGGPDTVTGNIIREAVPFLLGRMPVLAGAGAGAEAGLGTQALASAGSGAVAMDPGKPRLSNVLDQIAPNAVTDFLKAKPGDEATVLGRIKSGLEMAGMDAAVGGIVRALRAMKDHGADFVGLGRMKPPGDAPSAPGAKPATAPVASAEGAPAPVNGLPLGDAAAPLVEIGPDIERQAAAFLRGEAGPHDVRVNLGRIGSAEDIQKALELVSSHIVSPGVQSHEATVAAADALGLAPADFLRGYAGSNLNAAQTTAMRFMLDSSSAQLVAFAKAAADPVATPEAQALFLRAFATHRALQQYFENARAEAGRTLNAWGIMSQQRGDQAKAVEQIIRDAGEAGVDPRKLATQVAELDNPLAASRFVAEAGRDARGMGMTLWYNALLSNPRTVVKKLVSDLGMMLWNTAVRYGAETYGASGEVAPGEAAQLAYGYISAQRDAMRVVSRALKAGESQFHPEAQTMDGLAPKIAALADGHAGPLAAVDEPAAGALAWWRSAMPSSWIAAADDWAKFTQYRAELRALAFRDAMAAAKDGPDLATHMAGVMDAPPQAMVDQAWQAARLNTFQAPLTGFPKALEGAVDLLNVPLGSTGYTLPVGRILMPFVKVPANIAAWSYRNTPLALAFPTQQISAELAAGGATRDLAVARISLGSAVALSAADLALTNTITGKGPSDPQLARAWRDAGNQPYSIRVGDTFYHYNHIEPLGLLMGAIADTFTIARFAKDEDREALATGLILGAGNAMLSKTYMQGISDFFDALHAPETSGPRWADRLAGALIIPAGVAAAAQSLDPFVRAHYNMLQAVERRIPYLSEGLPPQRSLWGDPITASEGFMPPISGTVAANILSPVPMHGVHANPIDTWIWDNRAAFPRADDNKLGISKVSRFQSFGLGPDVSVQLELTPAQHDRLQVLAGNEIKDPSTGLGARDYLNALVEHRNPDGTTQRMWDQSSPAMQALIVQHTIGKFRDAAKRQMIADYPDIADALQTGAQLRAQKLQAPAAPAPAGGATMAPRINP